MSLWLLVSLFTLAPTVGAQDKFALVIGNGDYSSLPKVKNAFNDASDLADQLSSLGFRVQLLKNADLNAMDIALLDLGARLGRTPNSYGFFYFAGHGVASQGDNYLLPSDAEIPTEQDLRGRALAVQDVLDTLHQSRNPLNVVVLDASRKNPFRWGSRLPSGLAALAHQPEGSLVAYSAGPGATTTDRDERNGLFTSRLILNLKDPTLDVQGVFRTTTTDVMRATDNGQIPVVYGQSMTPVILAPQPAPVALPPPTPPPKVAVASSTDKVGTPGPGGGIIIFNKGNNDGGWQYLEAAPEDLPPVPWFNGKDGLVTGATGTGIGTGRDNSAKILAIEGPGTYAASACAGYEGGGFHDWFLPSKDELAQLAKVLNTKAPGPFSKFEYYWSSSERDPSDSWVQNLGDGGQYFNLKGFKHPVRPIRAF